MLDKVNELSGNLPVVFVADDENSYLEEQKDGTYIFYYGKYSEKLSKEEAESGVYDRYLIIKYNEK